MPGLMDKLKGAASAAKVKVDVVVDKASPKVKQTYEKVSDKVEKVIPGKKDSDADDKAEGADIAADETGDAQAAEEVEVQAAAQAEEAAAVAAEKAEGEAD